MKQSIPAQKSSIPLQKLGISGENLVISGLNRSFRRKKAVRPAQASAGRPARAGAPGRRRSHRPPPGNTPPRRNTAQPRRKTQGQACRPREPALDSNDIRRINRRRARLSPSVAIRRRDWQRSTHRPGTKWADDRMTRVGVGLGFVFGNSDLERSGCVDDSRLRCSTRWFSSTSR